MLRDELLKALSQLPAIDVHSHLPRNQLAAKSPDDLMFYHMLLYPMRAAGVSESKLWPPGESFHSKARPVADWLERWPKVRNTGFGWVLRTILKDLYDWHEEITAQSLPRLVKAFADKVAQQDWGRQVMDRGNIQGVCSSTETKKPLPPGSCDEWFRPTIEVAPTTGTREGESWQKRLSRLGEHMGIEIRSVETLRQAVRKFYDRYDWSKHNTLVSWISSQGDFRPVSERAVTGLIEKALAGGEVSFEDDRLLEGALLRATCEAVRGRAKVFQICYGVQFRTPQNSHSVQVANPEFAHSFAWLAGEYPEIHFNILSGYEPDEPIWCGHCVAYNNVSMGSYWWMTFYGAVMHNAWHRRLDMVPTTRLCAFFSDGYVIDYVYGRLALTRRVLANVLAEKIDQGFYTMDDAIQVARDMLYETPRSLFFQ